MLEFLILREFSEWGLQISYKCLITNTCLCLVFQHLVELLSFDKNIEVFEFLMLTDFSKLGVAKRDAADFGLVGYL